MMHDASNEFMADRSEASPRWAAGLLDAASASHWRACLMLLVLTLALFLPGFVSLQPMDRDEPRFAQASKQMLETQDFVDIRFQDDSRYKKPVGIYWLQSASVAAGSALGVNDALRTIALYRIPSLLGAIGAVLLTYWTALALLPRRHALLAAALLAGSILLGVEARLAKTDAVLLATVLATMGVLARLWIHTRNPATIEPPSLALILLFWVSMGFSVLVKGPITLMVVLLCAGVLAIRARGWRWLLALRPGLGLGIVALIVLPWLMLIVWKSGTAFFSEAIGKDMIGKVGGGQERHGAPPGTYLAVVWATFWPGSAFLALSLPFAWRCRRDDAVVFLLAWLIPSWLVFEAVPTKLPHYVLPLYPALAMLVALAIERGKLTLAPRWARIAAGLVAVVPLALFIGLPLAFVWLDGRIPVFAILLLALAAALSVLALRALWRREVEPALLLSLAAAFMLSVAAYPFGLPQLEAINLSRRLAGAADAVADCARPVLVTTGYREPSLVFLTSTGLLMRDGAGAADVLKGDGCRIAFVDQRSEEAFRSELGQRPVTLAERVSGFNINSGKRVDIGVYVKR